MIHKEKDIILELIKEECKNNGFAYEPSIIKKVTLLNISPEKYKNIKNNLIYMGEIEKDRFKIFIFK